MRKQTLAANSIFFVTEKLQYYFPSSKTYVTMTDSEVEELIQNSNASLRHVATEKQLFHDSVMRDFVDMHPEYSTRKQSVFVDEIVFATINSDPYRYDSFAEVLSWTTDVRFGTEATQIHSWVKDCYLLQEKILSEEVVYATLDEVRAALPVFNVTPSPSI